MSTYVDLTHTLNPQTPVFPSEKSFQITEESIVNQNGYSQYTVHTNMHVGTHIDAPIHFIPDGKRISDFPPEKFVGRGVLIDCRGKTEIGPDSISSVQKEDIVLFWTDWSKKFYTPEYFGEYPHLTESCARELVTRGVSMIGMDFPSPDRAPWELHPILLGAGVLLIENMTNLSKLEGKQFEVIAIPPKIEADGAIVRVVARID